MESARHESNSKRARKRRAVKRRKQQLRRQEEELDELFQKYSDDKVESSLPVSLVPTSPFTFSSLMKPRSLVHLDTKKYKRMVAASRGQHAVKAAAFSNSSPSSSGGCRCSNTNCVESLEDGRFVQLIDEELPSCPSETEFVVGVPKLTIMERMPVPGRRGGHSAPPTVLRSGQKEDLEPPLSSSSNSISSLADLTDRCDLEDHVEGEIADTGEIRQVKCSRRASSGEPIGVHRKHTYSLECTCGAEKRVKDGLRSTFEVASHTTGLQQVEQGAGGMNFADLDRATITCIDDEKSVIDATLLSESPRSGSEGGEHLSDTVDEEKECIGGHIPGTGDEEVDMPSPSEDHDHYEVIDRSEEHEHLRALFQHRRQSWTLADGAKIHIFEKRPSSPIDERAEALSPALRRLKARLEAGRSGEGLHDGNEGTQEQGRDDKQQKARSQKRKSGGSAVKWAAARRMRSTATFRPSMNSATHAGSGQVE